MAERCDCEGCVTTLTDEDHVFELRKRNDDGVKRLLRLLDAARAEAARLQNLVDSHEAVLRALHERVDREARWAAQRPEDD